jgi:hypothetical protein
VLFHIDDANAGMQVKCRACGGLVRIPGPAPAVPQWYYTRNRQPVGPVSFAQLQQLAGSGQLGADDLVWQEGMPAWTPANTVVGLLGLLSVARPAAKPPPVPAPAPAPLVSPPAAQPPDDDIADVIEVPQPPAYDELAEVAPEVLIEAEPPRQPAPSSRREPGGPDAWPVAPSRTARASADEDATIKVEREFQLDWHDAPPPWPDGPPPHPRAEVAATSATTGQTGAEVAATSATTGETEDYEVVDENPAPEASPPVVPSLELGAPEPPGWEPAPPGEPHAPITDRPEQAAAETPVDLGPAQPGTYALEHGDQAAANVVPPATTRAEPAKRPRPVTGKQTEKREEDRLVRRSIAEARRNWRRVSRGINLIYGAMCVWVVTWAIFVIIVNIASVTSQQPSHPGNWPTVMGRGQSTFLLLTAAFVTCVGLLVDATSIVGYSLCLFVPQPKAARGLAIASLALAVFALLIGVAGQLLPLLLLGAALAGFARWLIFLVFLRIVADYFDARVLKEDIDRLLVRAVISIGVWVAAAIILIGITVELAREQHTDMAKVPLMCAAISYVFLLASVTLRYVQVLRDSSAWIDERLYRGGGD